MDRKNKTNSKKDLNDTTSSADYLKSNELCGYSLTEELAEESDYMRDFISDDQDHITGVRFICISEKKDFQI